MRCRRTLRQARQQKRCARSAILIYPISRAWSRRAVLVATDANSVCRSEALLRAERADARSVKQSVRFQPSMPRTSVGRCATPGASHPPAVRTQSTVTFLNGRNGDICIWWTHIMCADEVDGDLGVAQVGEDAFAQPRGLERRSAARHDSIVSRFQLAAQLLTFLAQIARRPGEEDRVGGRRGQRSDRGGARSGHRLQHSREVLSDIINPGAKYLESVRARIEQEIASPL